MLDTCGHWGHRTKITPQCQITGFEVWIKTARKWTWKAISSWSFSLCKEIWSLRCICLREICFPFVHDQFHPSLCLILTVFGYVHRYFLPFNFVYKGFVANIFSSLKILFCRVSSWVFVPWKAFSLLGEIRNYLYLFSFLPVFSIFPLISLYQVYFDFWPRVRT